MSCSRDTGMECQAHTRGPGTGAGGLPCCLHGGFPLESWWRGAGSSWGLSPLRGPSVIVSCWELGCGGRNWAEMGAGPGAGWESREGLGLHLMAGGGEGLGGKSWGRDAPGAGAQAPQRRTVGTLCSESPGILFKNSAPLRVKLL